MTKTELNKLTAEIIRTLGQPEWELNRPINESARKLAELRQAYSRELAEINKTKVLISEAKQLDIPTQSVVVVPDELLKDSWLTPFNDESKAVIKCWMADISQSMSEIALETGLGIGAVRSTFRSEAFKLLRGHLALAYKALLPLEAVSALRLLLRSKTENVALQAAKLILIDAGLYKGESLDITNNKPKEILLDAATEEKLRKLGNSVLGVNENE